MDEQRPWRIEDADDPGDFLESADLAVHSHNPARRLSAIAVVKERIADVEEDAVEHAVAVGMMWAAIAARLRMRKRKPRTSKRKRPQTR